MAKENPIEAELGGLNNESFQQVIALLKEAFGPYTFIVSVKDTQERFFLGGTMCKADMAMSLAHFHDILGGNLQGSPLSQEAQDFAKSEG